MIRVYRTPAVHFVRVEAPWVELTRISAQKLSSANVQQSVKTQKQENEKATNELPEKRLFFFGEADAS